MLVVRLASPHLAHPAGIVFAYFCRAAWVATSSIAWEGIGYAVASPAAPLSRANNERHCLRLRTMGARRSSQALRAQIAVRQGWRRMRFGLPRFTTAPQKALSG